MILFSNKEREVEPRILLCLYKGPPSVDLLGEWEGVKEGGQGLGEKGKKRVNSSSKEEKRKKRQFKRLQPEGLEALVQPRGLEVVEKAPEGRWNKVYSLSLEQLGSISYRILDTSP